MPAAAVIPAPIAYVKVVAVKKLVVELRRRLQVILTDCTWRLRFCPTSVCFLRTHRGRLL